MKLKTSCEYNLSTKIFGKQITAQKIVKIEEYNHDKTRENTMINFPEVEWE